jgi:PilZ domain
MEWSVSLTAEVTMSELDSPVEVVVLAHPARDDRRRSPRYPSDRLTLVRSNGSAKALARPAVVRDVSATGLSLQLDWKYLPGTVLAVSPLGWTGPRILIARVVRSQQNERGWLHGCELADELGELELLHWQKGP